MNTTAQPTTDARRQAKFLYWTGWRVTDIAVYLSEKEKTVHSWKARDEWDRADNVERIGLFRCLNRVRLTTLRPGGVLHR